MFDVVAVRALRSHLVARYEKVAEELVVAVCLALARTVAIGVILRVLIWVVCGV